MRSLRRPLSRSRPACRGAQCKRRPQSAATVEIDDDDIGGVVTSRFGPEAGVWVIAETSDLGTRFAKMVVTDDLGRYVLPDLPKATYKVWVRGYGLVDSPKVTSEPGKIAESRPPWWRRASRPPRNIIRRSTGSR